MNSHKKGNFDRKFHECLLFLGKSKQRNKKDAVKSTDVCTNESKAVESTEGQKEVTPEVTEAVENKQPSTKEPSVVNIELAQNDVQKEQTPPSNHVVENHISETISEDTTTNVIIEETDNTAAVENGNGSATSSAPASKSSSQIKLKYQYPEGTVLYLIHSA